MKSARCLLMLLLFVCLWASAVLGAWSHDPSGNNVVCDVACIKHGVKVISDGDGGAVCVWDDARDGDSDVYAQHMDATGSLLWPYDGLPICTLATYQGNADIAQDGQGCFVIVWDDDRDMTGAKEIYAQRITADGLALWTPGGVALSTSEDYNQVPWAVADGSGGAYVVWGEEINKAGNALHGQHVSAAGDTLWGPGGIVVSGPGQFVTEAAVAPDGEGGLLVVWSDLGVPRVQRYNALAEPAWGTDGVTVLENPQPAGWCDIMSDGQGGAIVVLQAGYGGDGNVYAQRIDAWGTIRWSTTGLAVCEAAEDQTAPLLAGDGAGGIYVAWTDGRDGYYSDVYAQHVSASGLPLWAADGIQISTSPDTDEMPAVLEDGAGGVIIAWQSGVFGYADIWAQRLDAAGNSLWPAGGVLVSSAPSFQVGARLASDGAGGAIAAWIDYRAEVSIDIYAQRIERNGFLGYPAPCLESIDDYPADQGGEVIVTWDPSYLDVWPGCGVDYYSVWRRYPGPGVLAFAGSPLPSFTDEATLSALLASGWIYAGEVEAWQLDGYSYVVPSFGDSTADGVHYVECMVLAYNTALDDFWMSEVLEGYSVDNLAPGAPLGLAAEVEGADVSLRWTASGYRDEDLHHYDIHRSDVSGFMPDPGTLVGTAPDTFYLDPDPGPMTWYYRVIAEDVHGNEGEPSNEASANPGAGVDGSPLPEALAILGTGPNPFSTSARIAFGVPETARITLAVFSVDGRLVATLIDDTVEAGRRQVSWPGTDDSGKPLPSGVYFVRLTAGASGSMHKVVLLR
jgi:hypothetical protein